MGQRHGPRTAGRASVAAQIEAVRAGHADPLLADSDDDGIPDGQAHAAPR